MKKIKEFEMNDGIRKYIEDVMPELLDKEISEKEINDGFSFESENGYADFYFYDGEDEDEENEVLFLDCYYATKRVKGFYTISFESEDYQHNDFELEW